MDKQEIIKSVLEALEEKVSKESRVYGWITIALSCLDVLCGAICVVYTTLQVTALVVSILSGAVVCSRAVQVLKAKNLLNTIRIIAGLSSTYTIVRLKRGSYMNAVLQAIKNNPLTIIFAVLGAGVMFYVGFVLSGLWFEFSVIGNVLVGVFCAILTILIVVLLGWDKAKAAILRSAQKVLSKEAYDNLVNVAKALEDEEAKINEEKLKQEELEKAKLEEEAYQKAKETIAKYEQTNNVSQN